MSGLVLGEVVDALGVCRRRRTAFGLKKRAGTHAVSCTTRKDEVMIFFCRL